MKYRGEPGAVAPRVVLFLGLSQLVWWPSGCLDNSDVAGYLHTGRDAGEAKTASPGAATSADLMTSESSMATVARPSAERPFGEPGSLSWVARDAATFSGRLGQGPSPGLPGEFDSQGDALWISGWPLSTGAAATADCPLETLLTTFFSPPRAQAGFQVGVWARGDEAQILAAWWASLSSDGAEFSIFEDQRFVLTSDATGTVYAVSTELPPPGIGSLLPIPEGL